MNKYFIILLALGISTASWSMEKQKKQDNKNIIAVAIEHPGSIYKTDFNADNSIIFFCSRGKNNTATLELFDIKQKKIIKTVEDIEHNFSPIINAKNPSICAYLCNVYDPLGQVKLRFELHNIKKNTSFWSCVWDCPIKPDFIIDNNYLFITNSALKIFRIIPINYEEKYTENIDYVGSIISYTKSPHKQHLFVSFKNFASLYNLKTGKSTDIAGYNIAHAFNPGSTLCAFFAPSINQIILSKLEDFSEFNRFSCNAVEHVIFPNDDTVLFSQDRTTYYVWNIHENKPNSAIKLNGRNYNDEMITIEQDGKQITQKYEFCTPNKRYVVFNVPKTRECSVYDLYRKSLHHLTGTSNSKPVKLIFNDDETLALLTDTKNSFTLFQTDDWEATTILLDNGFLNPHVFFSPCGNYIIACSQSSKEISVFDICSRTCIVTLPWRPLDTMLSLTFYGKNIIAFTSTAKRLVLIDYKNKKIAQIQNNKKITYFAIKDDIIVLSSGQRTNIIDYQDLVFESLLNKEEKKLEKLEKEINILPFYDEKGQLTVLKINPQNEVIKEAKSDSEENDSCIIL